MLVRKLHENDRNVADNKGIEAGWSCPTRDVIPSVTPDQMRQNEV
jgi:hypothetical protein